MANSTKKILKNGTVQWRNASGELHRTDGPAHIELNGFQAWYQNDERHRTDGPAIIYPHGRKEWWVNDQLHRDDGPAVIRENGTEEFYLNGKKVDASKIKSKTAKAESTKKILPNGTVQWRNAAGELHRTDGPARICPDGSEEWYQNGYLHRTDGPAVIRADGKKEYWVNGGKVTAKQLSGVVGTTPDAKSNKTTKSNTILDALIAISPPKTTPVNPLYNQKDIEVLTYLQALHGIEQLYDYYDEAKLIRQSVTKVPDAVAYLKQAIDILKPGFKVSSNPKVVKPGKFHSLSVPKIDLTPKAKSMMTSDASAAKAKQLAEKIAEYEAELKKLKQAQILADKKLRQATKEKEAIVDIDPKLLAYFSYIEEHCGEYLTSVEQTKKLLYRGQRDQNAPIFRAYPRSDREPSDSSIAAQKLLDKYMKLTGFKALRSNSIFTSSNLDLADGFGHPYVIFPKDGFDFTWSEDHDDLVLDELNLGSDISGMFGKYDQIITDTIFTSIPVEEDEFHDIVYKKVKDETQTDAITNSKQFKKYQNLYYKWDELANEIGNEEVDMTKPELAQLISDICTSAIDLTTGFPEIKSLLPAKMHTALTNHIKKVSKYTNTEDDTTTAKKVIETNRFSFTDFDAALESGHEVCILGEYVAVDHELYSKELNAYFLSPSPKIKAKVKSTKEKAPPLSKHNPRENPKESD